MCSQKRIEVGGYIKFYTDRGCILRFSVEVKDKLFVRVKGSKVSSARKAEQRNAHTKAKRMSETFEPFTLMKRITSPSKLKPDRYNLHLCFRLLQ